MPFGLARRQIVAETFQMAETVSVRTHEINHPGLDKAFGHAFLVLAVVTCERKQIHLEVNA